jgi:TetR/AcrR family transcriptional regulator, repressor for uid operon
MCAKVSLQHKLEIRERIIAATLISFSKKGFDKTRMESNVSKGTLYIYFKSKEDLFYARCEKNLVELRNQLFSLFVANHEGNDSNNPNQYPELEDTTVILAMLKIVT